VVPLFGPVEAEPQQRTARRTAVGQPVGSDAETGEDRHCGGPEDVRVIRQLAREPVAEATAGVGDAVDGGERVAVDKRLGDLNAKAPCEMVVAGTGAS
jgi:hypothetical protein